MHHREACPGSLAKPGERRKAERSFLPTSLCPECGHWVEIHPIEPGGEDVWRVEMHDMQGRTMRVGEHRNPDPDAVMPSQCVECGGHVQGIRANPPGVIATCGDCGHEWATGFLNERA